MGTVFFEDRRARYLAVTLRGVDYAIPLLAVREVHSLRAVSPLPGTPPAVFGVLALREGRVPVIDLPAELSPAEAPRGRSCILVLEVPVGGETLLLGLVADSACEIIEGAPEPREATTLAVSVSEDWLAGSIRSGARSYPLLDVAGCIQGRSWTITPQGLPRTADA
ncbi:MAG TPA: chemotaxis protein CheW [Anaeromyxobacteraceae bacterium]|nr:chemotaxis protein CheW [Anaeromyxobacteraceae bacterium]